MKNLLMASVVVFSCAATHAQVITTNFISSNDAAVWYRTDDPAYGSAVTGADVDMDVYCHVPIRAYAYIQFDLSALGTNITIVSASLEVTKCSTNPVQSFAGGHSASAATITDSRFACYGLNNVPGNTPQNWSDGTLSFNATGNELTTVSAMGSDPFNTTNGLAASFNGLEIIGGGTNISVTGNAMTAFVQSRINDGGLMTFMIDMESHEPGRGFAFNTKESGLVGAMPALTLGYIFGDPPPPSVQLVDNGGTATLRNGHISLRIDKSNGQITDLRKGGPNLLANGGRIYFDANGSVDGGDLAGVPFEPDEWIVVTNTPQRVEVSLLDTNFTGFHTELHYVLREGEGMLDVFSVFRHGPGEPEAVLSQLRMAVRCDPNLFTMAHTDTTKTGPMIEPALLASAEEFMDATYKLPLTSSYTNEAGHTHDGHPVYTKYDWVDYNENLKLLGLAGDQYGLWLLMGSVEYYNGGPTKAGGVVHGTATTPIILWTPQGGHYGSEQIEIDADEVWTKVFGPFSIYVNSGTNATALRNDALQQAEAAVAAWPPDWMTLPGFSLDRGTVCGKLHVLGQSTSNALMVLAGPGEYWHVQEATGYQFWTRAEADGSFAIPKVEPGTYSLYAQVPGVVGLMEKTNIIVTAGATNDLGCFEWKPARYERRLFRLGTPDLSTEEFRFGSEMRQYGLWWRYQEERGTNDLDFTIGESDPAAGWYYALTTLPVELTPTNGIWVSPRWNIHFTVDEIPPSPARLSVELAGASSGCAFYVYVNGVNICPNPVTGIYTVNDSGIYRSAVRSSRRQPFEITFDPSLLMVGSNTVTFTVRATGRGMNPWSGSKPVYPYGGMMFDCIQLEAGSVITNPIPQFKKVEHSGEGLIVEGDGGLPEACYFLLRKTRLTNSSWEPVQTNVFNGAGMFAITNLPDHESAFYRLVIR